MIDDERITLDPPGVVIRRATARDAAVIALHRVCVFRDMGQVPTEELAVELLSESTSAIKIALDDGSYAGWLALDDREQVAAAAASPEA